MTDARTTDREVAPLRERLWAAAVDADEAGAVAVLRGAAQEGRPKEALLLDVVAAVQRRVGEKWAANRITAAAATITATATATATVAARAHGLPRPTGHRPRVTVAGVDGQWHALPARLVAETPRCRGRRVDFPGAHVPTPHLVAHLHATGPEAVLLSASLPTRLPTAHAALTACQSIGVPVESLHLGLTVLAGHLYDFPRARRFLNETAPDLDSFATTLSVTGTGTPA